MPATKKLPREILHDLWKRTGLSGIEVAQRAGYKAPSGFYGLMQPKQGTRRIPHESILKLIPVLRGLGTPPITTDELLAISDAAPEELSSRVGRGLSTAMSTAVARGEHVAETGGDLLPIRLRAERGVYVDPAAPARRYGASIVGTTPEYGLPDQFAVLVTDDHASPWYRRGAQLHVVKPSAMERGQQEGRRVVVFAGSRDGLSEVVIGRYVSADGVTGEPVIEAPDGSPLVGTIAAVVVGVYGRE